jgi:predicted GIY-YIG superfamily endonuclease
MRAIKSTPGKGGQQSRWVVYRYFAGDGALLYVGVTSRWTQRDGQHQGTSAWYAEVARFELEHYEDRSVAAHREGDIIQTENPRHNRRRFGTTPPYPQTGRVLVIHTSTDLLSWLRAQADRRNMSVNAYTVTLLEGLREFYDERQEPGPMGWHKKV